MLSKEASQRALLDLFRKRYVADLETLFKVLGTRSRMSVFRRLRQLGYLSSYTHTGRYYTLASIPEFDADSLWRHGAIGFSRLGTLRATIIHRVNQAEAGCTHGELEALLRVRVYSTLHRLFSAGELHRERVGGTYLYLSQDDARARQQVEIRQRLGDTVPAQSLPPDEVVLLVLVEVLHASKGLAPPTTVASRLEARGEAVLAEQVGRIYEHFGLEVEKKTFCRRSGDELMRRYAEPRIHATRRCTPRT